MSKILKNFLLGLGILFGIVVLINIMSFFTIVNPGERGILMQLGNLKTVYEPGLHFQMPFINNVVIVDVQTQKYEDVVDAASKDLQSIEGTVALNYHVDPGKVDVLFREVGLNFSERIIGPVIQESVKSVTAQYTAEELITKRHVVKGDIFTAMQERLKNYNIIVDDVSIVNFNFSEEFNKSIESKQTAVQNALRAENDLRRIEIEAKQTIETAKADAESIRIQGEALKQNAGLVQLKMEWPTPLLFWR